MRRPHIRLPQGASLDLVIHRSSGLVFCLGRCSFENAITASTSASTSSVGLPDLGTHGRRRWDIVGQAHRLRWRTAPSPISPPLNKASVAGSGTGKSSVPYPSCCSPSELMSASAPHYVPLLAAASTRKVLTSFTTSVEAPVYESSSDTALPISRSGWRTRWYSPRSGSRESNSVLPRSIR